MNRLRSYRGPNRPKSDRIWVGAVENCATVETKMKEFLRSVLHVYDGDEWFVCDDASILESVIEKLMLFAPLYPIHMTDLKREAMEMTQYTGRDMGVAEWLSLFFVEKEASFVPIKSLYLGFQKSGMWKNSTKEQRNFYNLKWFRSCIQDREDFIGPKKIGKICQWNLVGHSWHEESVIRNNVQGIAGIRPVGPGADS